VASPFGLKLKSGPIRTDRCEKSRRRGAEPSERRPTRKAAGEKPLRDVDPLPVHLTLLPDTLPPCDPVTHHPSYPPLPGFRPRVWHAR
jgi:hypothetical protein